MLHQTKTITIVTVIAPCRRHHYDRQQQITKDFKMCRYCKMVVPWKHWMWSSQSTCT